VRVPLSLIRHSRMPLSQIVELREGLKKLRSAIAAADAS